MIGSTRVSKLLAGYRGKASADMRALEESLVKLSYLFVDFPEIVEMDINPLQARPDGICALDARIMIEPRDVRKIVLPGSHLIISMYPSKYRWQFEVDGTKMLLRPIRPEDEPLWTDMINSISEQTQVYRFFGPVKDITKEMLVRYCHIDYDREMAIVALEVGKGKKTGRMLGVARLIVERADAEEAEFGIVVRDEYQRKGVGHALMDSLIQTARDMRIRVMTGDVLSGNQPMLNFSQSLGFEVQPGGDHDVRRIVLRL
jgi:acetyltransferase